MDPTLTDCPCTEGNITHVCILSYQAASGGITIRFPPAPDTIHKIFHMLQAGIVLCLLP